MSKPSKIQFYGYIFTFYVFTGRFVKNRYFCGVCKETKEKMSREQPYLAPIFFT